MKTTPCMWMASLFALAVMAAPVGLRAATVVIYSENFNGGATSLNGVAPTTTVGSNTWKESAPASNTKPVLSANGQAGGVNGSLLLPFTPETGKVYTLTASLNTQDVTAISWVGIGFSKFNPTSPSDSGRFQEATITGYSWLRATATGTSNESGWSAAGSSIFENNVINATGTHTLTIVLDTTAANWTTTMFINNTQMGSTFVYTSNPAINFVGFSGSLPSPNSGVLPVWESFQLSYESAAVPEPATAACILGAWVGACALARRNKRG